MIFLNFLKLKLVLKKHIQMKYSKTLLKMLLMSLMKIAGH